MKRELSLQVQWYLKYFVRIYWLTLGVKLAEGQLGYYGSSLLVRRTSPISFRVAGAQYTATVTDELGYDINVDVCSETSLFYGCLEIDGDTCFGGFPFATVPSVCINEFNPLGLGFGYREQSYLFELGSGVAVISRRLNLPDNWANNAGTNVISQTTLNATNPLEFHLNVLNQPPHAVMLPIVAVRYGCPALLEIPIYDSDRFDTVRCELPTDENECGGVCPLSLGITVQSYPCELNIPSVQSQAGSLQEPVSLVIIDTNIHGHDVSRVSLQFTLEFRDVITATNESCVVPGYDPSSIVTTSGGITRMRIESNYRNRVVYERSVGSATHIVTPRGTQSRGDPVTSEPSFDLVFIYAEGQHRLPEIVCFQYIVDSTEMPSQVLCHIFVQGRANFSRTAIAGIAGELISLELSITSLLPNLFPLSLDSSPITANGDTFTISNTGPFISSSTEVLQVQLHSNAGPKIEVGMIFIPEVEGPEVLVYTHPAGSTDLVVTVTSVEILGANENLRVTACRTGDTSITGIVYFTHTNPVEHYAIDIDALDMFGTFYPYFKIPIGQTCREFIIPLIPDRLADMNVFTVGFAVEGPLRLAESSSNITISLPSRCASSPCFNGGTCSEINELCACPEELSGNYCEIPSENTQPNPPNCPRSGKNITTVGGSLTAVATYGPFVCSESEQGLIEATCNPVSGSSFNIGQNEVTCTCTDSGGLVSSCNFLVSVTDNTGFNSSPSTPNCPSSSLVLRASEESNSAVANYGTISCSDVQQGSIVATCQPSTGSVFSVGATLVTCICVDDGNLTSSCVFIITVEELQETFPIWLVVVLSAASVFVISLLILMIMLILKRKQPNGKGTNQDTAMTVVADLNHSAAIGSDVYSQPVDGREKTLNEGGKVYSKRIHKYDRTNTRSNKDNTSEQNYSSKVYNEGHYYTVE